MALPCFRWTHSLNAPPGHPLADGPPTIERVDAYPLATCDAGFTGRIRIDQAFALAGLKPGFAITAMDADVIKTYVELGMGMGMGMGIVAGIAFEAERDMHLRAVDAGHLFGINLTKLAVRHGAYLRTFVCAFIEAFAPTLDRATVEAALAGDDERERSPATRSPAFSNGIAGAGADRLLLQPA